MDVDELRDWCAGQRTRAVYDGAAAMEEGVTHTAAYYDGMAHAYRLVIQHIDQRKEDA